MLHHITVLPQKQNIPAAAGQHLMEVLQSAGFFVNAPCGGNGTCGKCKVLVDGKETLACRTVIDRNMTVTLPLSDNSAILTDGIAAQLPPERDLCLAFDIGTTTVAAYLMKNGRVLNTAATPNPQAAFGADVVTRIRHAITGHTGELTAAMRQCVSELTNSLLSQAERGSLEAVCVVGNPAMQQLFLGMPVENLARPPFSPLLTRSESIRAGDVIPAWEDAALLIVPNIAGYIGADTVACILAAGMHQTDKICLLIDIGTNGEIVLGSKDRLMACATAAGPALEGAGIHFGMRAQIGAIDRVDQNFVCHTIGEEKAVGICGSGLLDAVAAALHKGLINERGRILNSSHTLSLTDNVYLTQEDIRQFQQAKGAIAAGIELLAQNMRISLADIETVFLAGAFGTFLDPRSACRVGLLPPVLERKIQPIGNAAGSGAKLIACNPDAIAQTDIIASSVAHLELAALPAWPRSFAKGMVFVSEEEYWCQKALSMGFSEAVPLDTAKLTVREDVRAMCADDKCKAFGKNWTCPPHCGTLQACEANMRRFTRGILLQTVGTTQKAIDTKAYQITEQRHLQQFHALAEAVKARHPHALCLGSGGCRICEKCAFPEPCRLPERASSSMEGYGLFVTEVCRDNGLAYHHGERTVTYTACVLF